MSNENVFRVGAQTVNKIYIGTTVVKESAGAITADLLDEVAREKHMSNFTVTDVNGNDLFPESFPFAGSVKMTEYNAAKAPYVFPAGSVAAPVVNKVYIGSVVARETSDDITAEILDEVAREKHMSNFTVTDTDGNDLFPDSFPFTGSVKMTEYNAAKAPYVFPATSATAPVVNKIYIGSVIVREIDSPVTAELLDEVAREKHMSNFTVTDTDGNDLFPDSFPFSGSVKMTEYNAAK